MFCSRCEISCAIFPEQFVAGGVAEGIVDFLEAVEVEQQQRRGRPRPAAPGQHIVDLAVEQGAVGEAGEGIVIGELFQLLLRGLALGDVLNGAAEARGQALLVPQHLACHDKIADRAIAAPELDVDAPGLAGADYFRLRFQNAAGAVVDIGRHDSRVTAAEGFRVVAEEVIEFRRPVDGCFTETVAPVSDLAEQLGFDELVGAMLQGRLGGSQRGFAFEQRAVLLFQIGVLLMNRPVGSRKVDQGPIQHPQRKDANGQVATKSEEKAEKCDQAKPVQQGVKRRVVFDRADRGARDDNGGTAGELKARRQLCLGHHDLSCRVQDPVGTFARRLLGLDQLAEANVLIRPHLAMLINISGDAVGVQFGEERCGCRLVLVCDQSVDQRRGQGDRERDQNRDGIDGLAQGPSVDIDRFLACPSHGCPGRLPASRNSFVPSGERRKAMKRWSEVVMRAGRIR